MSYQHEAPGELGPMGGEFLRCAAAEVDHLRSQPFRWRCDRAHEGVTSSAAVISEAQLGLQGTPAAVVHWKGLAGNAAGARAALAHEVRGKALALCPGQPSAKRAQRLEV